MNKLKELRQEKVALIKEARVILDKAMEEKRDLNETEQKKYDEIMTDVESRKNTIEREERQLELEKDMDKPIIEPIHNKPEPEVRGFKSLGEQLMSVIEASKAGGKVDQRLLETRTASGLSETVPSEGGFLVQTDFSTELLKRGYETGILASRVNKIPISVNSDGIKINAIDESSRATGSRWGGVQIYMVAEAETVTAKKPKFRQMKLELNKMMGICYATDDLMKDAVALEAVIMQAFTEEFGFKTDDLIWEGLGSGEPLGIMNSGAIVTVTRTSALKTDYADICSMYSRMWSRSRPNAIWLINQDIEPALFQMVLGTAPAYMPAGGLSGQPYGTLFNRPVIPIEHASSLGTTGDIMFADLKQYLMIDKGGLETASSIHVRFLYDEQVFRFIYRLDGQPTWDKPLTPFKGSATKSPFVVLSTKTS